MQADTSHMYYMAITAIEAQKMLIDMQIADYPHLKPEAKKKIHRKIHKMAYPIEKETYATINDIKATMNRINNGR